MLKRIDQITEDGKVFVKGDNVNNSTDSRSFGYINRSKLEGCAYALHSNGLMVPFTNNIFTKEIK